MKKRMMILQAFGLGDCIFAQGIACHFIKEGYDVVWPVKPQFVEALKQAYPSVTWIPDTIVKPELFNIKTDCVIDGVRILPIRWSDSILGQPSKYWMRTKFDLVGLDYKDWKIDAYFERNRDRQVKLCHLYGIRGNEKFNLINRAFRSDASKSIDIKVDNGLRNVEMDFIEGYSLFDHALLIEMAETIHVTNSAIFYLLELLDLSAKEVHLYCRKPDETEFKYVDYLMTKKYELHY